MINHEGTQVGVVSLAKAKELAEETDLDLVEIAPNAKPPVCKIMDYGKYLYGQSKKKQEAKKKQKQITVKEVKFRPVTDIGDYNVKVNRLTQFLNDGNKTKVTMRFRGREMAFPEQGMDMLKRVAVDLEEISDVEQHPKMEGRQMVMVLAPKKT